MEIRHLIKAKRSIIPVREDKSPLLGNWTDYATRYPTFVEMDSWRATHTGLWAMVTGRLSGVTTLDFDGPEAEQSMRKLGLKPHRRTPRGFHVDFAWDVLPLKSGNIRPGVDVRGYRGYVVVIGPGYEWLPDYKIRRSIPRGLPTARLTQ